MRTVPGALVGAALVVLGGCTTEPAPAPTPSPTSTAGALEVVDPDVQALEGIVVELRETAAALRTALEEATAGDAAQLEVAAALLVADVEAARDPAVAEAARDDAAAPGAAPSPGPGTAPLLPGPLRSRSESIQYGDLLTRALAAARGAGSAGEPVQRLLADPLAGDLGAWQRSPADQLAAIARAGTAGPLEATEEAVLDLLGEAPRALAWVVHGLERPEDATDAAARALIHLAVIELALEDLT